MFFGAGDLQDGVSDFMGALRLKLGKDLGLVADSWAPLWVTDFPMFEWDEEESRYVALHHPFTAPAVDDIADLRANAKTAVSRGYDMVLNGNEIGGGSIRIHNSDDADRRCSNCSASARKRPKASSASCSTRCKYGAPPHGGIAFGIDRIAALMAGTESIRDVIAFPKTTTAQCLMTGAPSPIPDAQLAEVHVSVRPKSAEPRCDRDGVTAMTMRCDPSIREPQRTVRDPPRRPRRCRRAVGARRAHLQSRPSAICIREDLQAFLADSLCGRQAAQRSSRDPDYAMWLLEARRRGGRPRRGRPLRPAACRRRRRRRRAQAPVRAARARRTAAGARSCSRPRWPGCERDGPRTLWIGVWSENLGAQRFYARYGFEKVGEYEFSVGQHARPRVHPAPAGIGLGMTHDARRPAARPLDARRLSMHWLAARLRAAGFAPEIFGYHSVVGGPDAAVPRLVERLRTGGRRTSSRTASAA